MAIGLSRAREAAAEQRCQFRDGEIEEGALAAGLERGGMAAAEIGLDHRPAERTDLVARGGHAVGVREDAAVRLELLGIGKRDEQLVGKSERQTARGFDLVGQGGEEQILLRGEHGGRQRHDRLIGGDGAFRGFDLQSCVRCDRCASPRNRTPCAAPRRRRRWSRHRPSTTLQFTPESW